MLRVSLRHSDHISSLTLQIVGLTIRDIKCLMLHGSCEQVFHLSGVFYNIPDHGIRVRALISLASDSSKEIGLKLSFLMCFVIFRILLFFKDGVSNFYFFLFL